MDRRDLLVLVIFLFLAAPLSAQESDDSPYLTGPQAGEADTAVAETEEDTPTVSAQGDTSTQFQLGYNAFRDGHLDRAISRLERALAGDSTYTEARYWLGKFYYVNGQNDSALETWTSREPRTDLESQFEREIKMHELRYGTVPLELSHQLRYVGVIPGNVHGDGRLTNPTAMEPAPGGGYYVSSYQLGKVIKYSPEGQVLEVLTGFNKPVDLSYRTGEGLYVLNGGDGSIQQISDTGVRSTWSTQNVEGAHKLISAGGRFYVFNIGSGKITQFSDRGETVSTIWTPGPQRRVNDVSVGPDGNFWILDQNKPEIIVMDSFGTIQRRITLNASLSPRRLWWSNGRLFGAGSDQFFQLNPEDGRASQFEVSAGKLPGGEVTDVHFTKDHLLLSLFEQSGIGVYRMSDRPEHDMLIQDMRSEFQKFPIIRINLLVEDPLGIDRYRDLADRHLSIEVENRRVLPSLLRHTRTIRSANWIMVLDDRVDLDQRLREIQPRLLDLISNSPDDSKGALWTVSDQTIKQGLTEQDVLLRNALRRIKSVTPDEREDTKLAKILDLALDSAFNRKSPTGVVLVSSNIDNASGPIRQLAQRFKNNQIPLVIINPSVDRIGESHPLRAVAPSKYYDFHNPDLGDAWSFYDHTLKTHYTFVYKSHLSFQRSNQWRSYELAFEIFDQTMRYNNMFLMP